MAGAQVIRVEFRLTMPGRASWNGRWSGEGKNYAVVRELHDEDVERLFGSPRSAIGIATRKTWTHKWSDGWSAEVIARVVSPGEELLPSHGFNGYDWMIENILKKGNPYGEVTS